MNELLTHENERIAAFFKNLDRILGSMAQMADNCRPLLDGERFLSDKELAERLKSQPQDFAAIPVRRAYPLHPVRRQGLV